MANNHGCAPCGVIAHPSAALRHAPARSGGSTLSAFFRTTHVPMGVERFIIACDARQSRRMTSMGLLGSLAVPPCPSFKKGSARSQGMPIDSASKGSCPTPTNYMPSIALVAPSSL
eukprot:1625223-Pleurochrysis_carterae.AAC.5